MHIIVKKLYMELIVEKDEVNTPLIEPREIKQINERFEIWYYDDQDIPPLSVGVYSYSAIPKCLAPCATEALEASGILAMQRQENLKLTGKGTYIAIIDSGINIFDDSFRNFDGSTRIAVLWDQENDKVYSEMNINTLIVNKNEDNDVISKDKEIPQDQDGHGTFLASVAAGSIDLQNDFVGAAPEAKLIVVKLKPASKVLKDFFFIPENATVYSEADVMLAVAFAENWMKENQALAPLVIFLGLACNNGSHCGTSPLAQYLDSVALQINHAVVTPTGNEGIRQHHYRGNISNQKEQIVEINIERDIAGFYLECWSLAPERVLIQVRSPNGETRPTSANMDNLSQSYRFPLEGTKITIDYRDVGKRRRDQLVFVRFENVPKGVWSIIISPMYSINGEFNIWLPMEGLLPSPVYFLQPDPDITITNPGDAVLPMTIGGYSLQTRGVYLESGRGFLPDKTIKPDFIAPCDQVSGKGLRNNYVTYSGTSVAAAITAGACAQILQWAVVEKNALGINSIDIKNFFIRGSVRLPGYEYPSTQTGYGRLEIYESFRQI